VKIGVAEGPVAFTVRVEGTLAGARSVRTVRLYREHPRIDFETELNDLPDGTATLAEFPLSSAINEVRRGVPYGFSHGAWEKNDPGLSGWNRDIVPAIRWSHYEMDNGLGVGLFDRGVTGRELDGRTAALLLYNAVEKYRGYPNAWLSGAGRHQVEYALVAHQGEWKDARVPQLAWEYNCPVIALGGAAPAATWLETSGNVVVEGMRRVGPDIELRFVEAFGLRGTAEIALRLAHTAAALTDMTGGRRVPLAPAGRYRVPVRPQQIVTMRFRTSGSVEEPKPRTEWDDLAPEHKRAALREYSEEKGNPPQGA
jgi:alpha-mannosidase